MIPTLIAALALGAPGDAAHQALDRFHTYWESAKSLSVDLEVEGDAAPGKGTGRLVIVKPDKLRFDMQWLDTNYSLALSRTFALEIERTRKVYNQFAPHEDYYLPKLAVSGVWRFSLPLELMHGNIQGGWPTGAKLTDDKGPEPGSDVVHMSSNDRMGGTSEAWATIDERGRLLKMETKQTDQGKSYHNTITLSHYKINVPEPAGLFTIALPAGYVPYRVAPQLDPYSPGSSLPATTWAKVSGGTTSLRSAMGGRRTLVAFVDGEADSSQRFLARRKELAAALGKMKVQLLVASVGGSSAAARKAGASLYDKSGSGSFTAHVPGTPFLYLLEPNGKVIQAWYGFEPSEYGSLVTQIEDALKS